MTDGPTTIPARRRQPASRHTGDAARRMLVTTVAITAVIAIGVAAWSFVRDDDDSSAAGPTAWNRIALVDKTTGAVTTYGPDGRQLDRTPGTGRIDDVVVLGHRLALVGRSTIDLVSPGHDDTISVAIPPGSRAVPVRSTGAIHLAVEDTPDDAGPGNLLIVDTADGSVIDLAQAAAPTEPLVFAETLQVSPDGTRFAVADVNNFQTIVVGDDIDGAAFLADQPIAVGDELVATSQVVNRQADVTLVDLERRRAAMAPTELPSGGVMIDDELLMVSVEGGIFRIGEGDRAAEQLGRIAMPPDGTVRWTAVSYLGERLVVGGSNFAAVVDLDGTVVADVPVVASVQTVQLVHPEPGWRCLPIFGADTAHSIIDLGTGESVGDLTGLTVTDVSADGCAVIAERDGVFELVDAGGAVRLGAVRAAAIAPDGKGVVWTTTSGRTEYVRLRDDRSLADPIQLTGAPVNLSVAFLTD